MQDKNAISAELSSKLWYEAKQNLSKEEQGYIRDFQGDSGDNHGIVNDVLKTAKEKQKEAQDKNWTFKRSDGRVVVVRDSSRTLLIGLRNFRVPWTFWCPWILLSKTLRKGAQSSLG